MLGPFAHLLRHPPHPYPGMSITVSWYGRQDVLWAQIDTGADVTFIPDWLVGHLRLRPLNDWVELVNPRAQKENFPLYSADLTFLGLTFRAQPVVPMDWDEVLIGLDILNAWVLTLDGPNRRFSIQETT